MNQEEHIDLIQKFLNGDATDQEMSSLIGWLNQSKVNRKLFRDYKEIWGIAGDYSKMPGYDVDAHWRRLESELFETADMKRSQKSQITKKQYPLLVKIAAVAAIFIGLVLSLTFMYNSLGGRLRRQVVRFETPVGQKANVYLDDGTLVMLNSGSTIEYLYTANSRKVFLTGEAYFDVVHNSDAPFEVEIGALKIRVLGTRFNVQAYTDNDVVKTTLLEGNINVMTKELKRFVLPGEQAVYDKRQSDIKVSKVDLKLETLWKENMLKIKGETLEFVIQKLEKWYSVSIQVDERLLSDDLYSLTIKEESLREMLRRMQLTTPMKYTIDGKKVKLIYMK